MRTSLRIVFLYPVNSFGFDNGKASMHILLTSPRKHFENKSQGWIWQNFNHSCNRGEEPVTRDHVKTNYLDQNLEDFDLTDIRIVLHLDT